MVNIQANGIYALVNVKGGTYLDLSYTDNASIVGNRHHQGPNQLWIFEDAGSSHTFYLKSLGSGQYLSVAGELHDGQRLVVAGSPYAWHVEEKSDEHGAIKFSPAHDRNVCIDLEAHGGSTPGTRVQVWKNLNRQNQRWRLQRIPATVVVDLVKRMVVQLLQTLWNLAFCFLLKA